MRAVTPPLPDSKVASLSAESVDLEYRRLGRAGGRAVDIAAAARRARAEFETLHPPMKDDLFPTIDPLRGDRSAVAGRIVALPAAPPSCWVDELALFLVAGDDTRGFYFAYANKGGFAQVRAAAARYEAKIRDTLDDEPYAVIGRITGVPLCVVIAGKARFGLEVEVLGAAVGEKLFVDATHDEGGAAQFAGEAKLAPLPETPHVAADAAPAEVLAAWVTALKLGDEPTWCALCLDWDFSRRGDHLYYHPYSPAALAAAKRDWPSWRRRVLSFVADLHPHGDSVPAVVDLGWEAPETVEEVVLAIDYVEIGDREPISDEDRDLPRTLTLQRVNQGPWRIVMAAMRLLETT